MNRPARPRQAEIIRTIKAAEKAGYAVASFEVTANGSIHVTTRAGGEQRDNFDGFFARRDAGRRA